MHAIAPGEAGGHAIDAPRDHAELVRGSLWQPLRVVAGGDALQRVRHPGEGLRETPPVVPQADSEHHEHRGEDDGGRRGGLDGIVRGVGGEVARGVQLGEDARGHREALRGVELLTQLQHRVLRAAGAAPHGDLDHRADDRDDDERHRQQARDAQRPAGPRRGLSGRGGGSHPRQYSARFFVARWRGAGASRIVDAP